MSRMHDALIKAGKGNQTISAQYTRGTILVEDADVVSGPRLVEGDEAPSLRDYWQVVTKHKWKILACFVAAVSSHCHHRFFDDADLHSQGYAVDRAH